MNCIILEWWIFNHKPDFWVQLAREHNLSLHVGEDKVIISAKEDQV